MERSLALEAAVTALVLAAGVPALLCAGYLAVLSAAAVRRTSDAAIVRSGAGAQQSRPHHARARDAATADISAVAGARRRRCRQLHGFHRRRRERRGSRGDGPQRVPWNATCSAEDLEYTVDLRLAGIVPRHAAEARLWAPASTGGRAGAVQRMRWEGGREAAPRPTPGWLAPVAARRIRRSCQERPRCRRRSRASVRWLPMNPAPPVTGTVFEEAGAGSLRIRCLCGIRCSKHKRGDARRHVAPVPRRDIRGCTGRPRSESSYSREQRPGGGARLGSEALGDRQRQ